MTGRNFILIVAGAMAVLALCRNGLSAKDVTGWIATNRSAYLAGRYQSAARAGMSALDGILGKQAARIQELLPVPAGSRVVNTASRYYCSIQSGILDDSVQAEKSYSNENGLVTMAADTSVNMIERTLNLIRSYEFLKDRGGVTKTTAKIRRTEWIWLTDGLDAYCLPVLIEKDGQVLSGLHLKISVTPRVNPRPSDREKTMDARVKEVLEILETRPLTNMLR